jgi:hypothetical protein
VIVSLLHQLTTCNGTVNPRRPGDIAKRIKEAIEKCDHERV